MRKSKSTLQRLVLALILGLACFAFVPAHAENSDTKAFMENGMLIIVDSTNKKILYYEVKTKGLYLKEIRSYAKALESPSFTSSKGLTIKDEAKALKKVADSNKED